MDFAAGGELLAVDTAVLKESKCAQTMWNMKEWGKHSRCRKDRKWGIQAPPCGYEGSQFPSSDCAAVVLLLSALVGQVGAIDQLPTYFALNVMSSQYYLRQAVHAIDQFNVTFHGCKGNLLAFQEDNLYRWELSEFDDVPTEQDHACRVHICDTRGEQAIVSAFAQDTAKVDSNSPGTWLVGFEVVY